MKAAMNASPERKIRKFNPGIFQSDEEVIEQFVVREKELGMAMETLRGNIDSPSCQHLLIVAPRGRGKTMLLARTAAEIRANSELSERLLPVRFMEESHEIFNIADFWLETLFHLAREIEGGNTNLAQELRETHSDLIRQWRGGDLEERAQAAILEAADRLKRQLVLMVENLQVMNNTVDDRFGWKLRKVLQTEPQIMLLATATTRFRDLDDAEQPFFELFRIISLDPLDTEESRLLWQMVSGDKVGERAIRPLEILTGGDPRLMVTIAQCACQWSMRELLEELVSLIDDHTEYFRAHLEGFAKTERRVYLAVIDLWQPSTANEIAARARMDIRVASSLLGRLADRGAIAANGRGKARRYFAVQRLYSIYYKMRHERSGAAVVNHLINFMIEFYSTAELVDVLATPVEARRVAATATIYKQGAYLQLDDPESAAAFFDQVVQQLDGEDGADLNGDLRENSGVSLEWRALWFRATALLRGQSPDLAGNIFRDLYSAFDPANHAMLRDMIAGVIQLVANGMPEQEAIDILMIEQEKADALAPLVAALRQRQGDTVSVAEEVGAVAEDVRKAIELGNKRRGYLLNHWLI